MTIEAHRLALNRLHLPLEWRSELQRLYIVRAVHGTTAIEGSPLSEVEVSARLDKRRKAKDQVDRQTKNAAAAFHWVEEQCRTSRPLRLDDILAMHRILTTGSDESDNVPGRLRASGQGVTVGSAAFGGVHRAPPGGEPTSRLMRQFIEFLHSRAFRAENPVIQALAAHFYFVTLHPFGNGNGRTTRCIEAAILFGGGYNTYGFYSLSNFFYRNRDDYFLQLQAARTRHRYDLTEFFKFGVRGFREELDRIADYVRNRTHRLHFREVIRRCCAQRTGPRRRLLNEREGKLLHEILEITEPADPFSNAPGREVTVQVARARAAPVSRKIGSHLLSRIEPTGGPGVYRAIGLGALG